MAAYGSPPRARGKALASGAHPGAVRITPACAGKSQWACIRRSRGRDHPRVRGEKKSARLAVAAALGSPPRARGKALATVCVPVAGRITPACAGKSIQSLRRWLPPPDHPRVRGEKLWAAGKIARPKGSPPRARGKATPRACTTRYRRDHPRVRGEKRSKSPARWTSSGSPPRARGKGIRKLEGQLDPGITPACAGKRLQKRIYPATS